MSDDETTQTESQRETMPGPLAAKIAEASGQIDSVPKNGQVNFGNTNYEYATADDIMSAAKDAMAGVGLAIIPSVVDEDWDSNGNNVYLTIEYTIVDGETGATWTSRWRTQGNDSGDKAYWKALTQGKKYFLRDVFCIPTGETHLDAEADDPETDHTPNARGQRQTPRNGGQQARQTSQSSGGHSEPDVDHSAQTKRLHALLGETALSDRKCEQFRDAIRVNHGLEVGDAWDKLAASTVKKYADRLDEFSPESEGGPSPRAEKVLKMVDKIDPPDRTDAAAE